MFSSLFSSPALPLPHRVPEGAPETEHRLLHKKMPSEDAQENPQGREKPKEGGEKSKDAKGDSAEKKVSKEAKETNRAVKDVVPEVAAPAVPVPEIPKAGPNYVAIPSITQGFRDMCKAVLTASGVALPPVGMLGLAGGGTLTYVGSKATSKPLSIGETLKRTFVSAPREGLRSIGRTLTFLPRMGGAAGINVLKFSVDKLYRGLDCTVGELYRDLRTAVNHKFKLPEGTNLLASVMIGLKRIAFFPKDFVKWYAAMFQAHPKTTLAISVAIPWITLNGAWPEVIAWGKGMATGILKIIQGIASQLTTTVPAIPPVVPPIP